MAAKTGNDRDVSDTSSQRSVESARRSVVAKKQPLRAAYAHYDDDKSDVFSVGVSRQHGGSPSRFGGFDTEIKFHDEFVYKVTDSTGNTHRIKASAESIEHLSIAVAEKIGAPSTDGLIIKYVDDDKDEVVISTDASVKEAVEFARSSGLSALKITATFPSGLAFGASSLLKGFAATMQTPAPKGSAAASVSTKGDGGKINPSAAAPEIPAASKKQQSNSIAVAVAGGAVAAVALIAALVVMRTKK